MVSWWVVFVPYLASKHERPTNPVKGLLCSGNVFSESFQTVLDFAHNFGYWILDSIWFSTASHLTIITAIFLFLVVFSIRISKLTHLSYVGIELLESL